MYQYVAKTAGKLLDAGEVHHEVAVTVGYQPIELLLDGATFPGTRDVFA